MPLLPQRDKNGDVVPHDHQEILPEHGIIRRISEQYIVTDDKCLVPRVSSMAFQASSGLNGGMSVDLQHEIEKAGLDSMRYVTTPFWIGSVRFLASQLRGEGFTVGADPIENKPGSKLDVEPNPYHGEVWGKFTKGKQNRLIKLCEWFVPIDGVLLSCK